jgi:hypothetical protein
MKFFDQFENWYILELKVYIFILQLNSQFNSKLNS